MIKMSLEEGGATVVSSVFSLEHRLELSFTLVFLLGCCRVYAFSHFRLNEVLSKNTFNNIDISLFTCEVPEKNKCVKCICS